MNNRFLPILFVSFQILLTVGAEQVKLELSRTTISMDETVDLLLRQEGRGMFRAPDIPLPDGLEIRGTSQRTQIINGQAEFTMAYTLAATRPGTFQIGPYRLPNQQEVPAKTLTVTPATAVRATEDLFATLEASAEEVLVRETVELTLTFFSTEPIGDINLLDFPEEGFELTDWQEIRAGARTIDGKRYQQKKYVARLTPTQAGILNFDPTFRIEVQERGAPRSMLFGGLRVRTERIQLQEPVIIAVTSPPEENRPEGYAGHIGTFRLSAEISPESVRVGDPITLRVRLEGSGSLKQALPPHYEASDSFKVYQPRVVTEDLRRDGLGGSKVLEQVVIPTRADLTELPELTFHFFHPETRTYQTVTAGPFPITVSGEEKSALPSGSLTLSEPIDELEALGDDLVYIKLNPGSLRSISSLTPGIPFATGAGLPFLLWALGSVWWQKQKNLQGNADQQRRSQAPKQLRKQLGALEAGDQFWASAWDILSTYLRDGVSLPPGELERETVLQAVQGHTSEEIQQELGEWISRCEQARFAAGTITESQPEAFRSFMIRLDQEVRS